MQLLFVASAPMEYTGMLQFAEAKQSKLLGCVWARNGHLNGHNTLMVANGAGWGRAAAAVDEACREFHPDAVISTGFCGALDPTLRVSSIVVGTAVRGQGEFPCKLGSFLRAHARGVVLSMDHIVRTAAEKRRLHAQGAAVVEMEAAGVASRAQALGLPFYCIRAVSDPAGEDLANDFNAALRPDGQFDTMRIFRHSLSRPVARVPELFRLRRNCLRAAKTLGEFFADCQF